ncbi:hypothetical protein YC2023_119194 [Brassica napus]
MNNEMEKRSSGKERCFFLIFTSSFEFFMNGTANEDQCGCVWGKINEERASMVAQFATETTLRKILAAEKDDDDMPPIEAIFAPLEFELKLP